LPTALQWSGTLSPAACPMTSHVDRDAAVADRTMRHFPKFRGERVQLRLDPVDQLLVALDLVAQIHQHQSQLKFPLGGSRHRADLLQRHQEAVHRGQVAAERLRHLGGGHLTPPGTQHVQDLERLCHGGILGCAKRAGHGRTG
jgi:hypothetical protein